MFPSLMGVMPSVNGNGGSLQATEARVNSLETQLQQFEAQTTSNIEAQAPKRFSEALAAIASPPPQAAPENAWQRIKAQITGQILPAGTPPSVAQNPRVIAAPAELSELITTQAKAKGLPVALLSAVIRQESGFNPKAKSSAGAMGLMQLMPGTAKALGVTNAFDPAQNVAGGATYLQQLLSKHQGNIPLALAAYNAGPGAVARHGGIPPYRETQQYVRNVLKDYLAQTAHS